MNIENVMREFEFERKMRVHRFFLYFWTSLTILYTFFMIFYLIVFPAYLSASDYGKQINSSEVRFGYYIAGAYFPEKDKIEVYVKNDTLEYYQTLKHETCHKLQHYENRSYTDFWGRFKNEIECKWKEYI